MLGYRAVELRSWVHRHGTRANRLPDRPARFRSDLEIVSGYSFVPVSTMSTCRLPHREHTSRSRQSRTDVSTPYLVAISLNVRRGRTPTPPIPGTTRSNRAMRRAREKADISVSTKWSRSISNARRLTGPGYCRGGRSRCRNVTMSPPVLPRAVLPNRLLGQKAEIP